MRIRPQILTAMLLLGILGALAIFFAVDYIEAIVPASITGIGMLGMKLLEGE